MFEKMSPVLMHLIFGILSFTLSAPALGHGTFAVFVLLLLILLCAAILQISPWNPCLRDVLSMQRTSYAILFAQNRITELGIYNRRVTSLFMLAYLCAYLVAIALMPFTRRMGQGGGTLAVASSSCRFCERTNLCCESWL